MPRWVFWMLLTLVSWGIWAVLSRLIERVSPGISAAHTQAMSTLGLAPIIVALWAMKDSGSPGNRGRGLALAFGSGVVSALANIAYYAALSDAKAATIVPLTALFPAVTILLAVPLLKEKITPLQCGGLGLSL